MADGFGVGVAVGVYRIIIFVVSILRVFSARANAIKNGGKTRKMMNKVVEAIEASASVMKTLSNSVHDLQMAILDVSEKQLAIIAALAMRGISINTEEIKELLNNESNDTSHH